jgi:hypothetical protein
MSADILKQFKAARNAAVPLMAISTPDPTAIINRILEVSNGNTPIVQWDVMRGMKAINDLGLEAVGAVGDLADATAGNEQLAVLAGERLPAKTIFFIHMGNRFLEKVDFLQAICNVRDLFKGDKRTLVLLGPDFRLPAELQNDVLCLDDPLPTGEQLGQVVDSVSVAAQVPVPDETRVRAVEAVQGLSAFAAEQAIAMSFTREGIHVDDLWERKRQQIEQCPALSVWREGNRFKDIGGYDNVKEFLGRVISGPARPNAIIFLDEIEKALGGEGDTSGVSQDQLGCLLTYMQDRRSRGAIFLGPAGSGKSAVAKSLGNEAGVPTIQLDLGSAKGSLVGESEKTIRQALKVITSVSNGNAIWVATCNSIQSLKPELRRRFKLGTFFFDLPTDKERDSIWAMYIGKYELPGKYIMNKPVDSGWTGAEIENCCELAYLQGITLKQAADYIVPVSRSAGEQIDALRDGCDGRYLSASYRGFYRKAGAAQMIQPTQRAAIELE